VHTHADVRATSLIAAFLKWVLSDIQSCWSAVITRSCASNKCKNRPICNAARRSLSVLFAMSALPVCLLVSSIRTHTFKGTLPFVASDGSAAQLCGDRSAARYLVAVCEQPAARTCATGPNVTFGVCIVETSTAMFTLTQFDDDNHCAALRTLLAHYPPVHVCACVCSRTLTTSGCTGAH
jgi:hypothetical protein